MTSETARLLHAADRVVALVQSGELFAADDERAMQAACTALDELEQAADAARTEISLEAI